MKALYVVVSFFLFGCAATGPTFQDIDITNPESGAIFIYRADSFALAVRDAYFYVDDINVFDLSRNGYSFIVLPAGKHIVKQKWAIDISRKSLEFPIEVEAGKKTYLSFETGVCGIFYMTVCLEWKLREEEPVKAAQEIISKRLQKPFK